MVTAVLNRPTLVLNRNWQPVGVATVARSLVKVWNDCARIVDPLDFQQYTWEDWSQLTPGHDEPAILTRSSRLRVPEVIVLKTYDRVPTNVVTFSRRNIFKRDRFMCQFCGRQPGSEELTIDHVLPRSQGGTSTWENCVLACIDCNARKCGVRGERTLARRSVRVVEFVRGSKHRRRRNRRAAHARHVALQPSAPEAESTATQLP